ncbi:hypothetical protein A2U01_0108628, partial [Trifolium medium]|nr:hypothetical protein [Trifolium medium]
LAERASASNSDDKADKNKVTGEAWRALATRSLSEQAQNLRLRPRNWPWSRPKHIQIIHTS